VVDPKVGQLGQVFEDAGSVLVGKILGGVIGAALAQVIHAENFIGAQAVGFLVCFVGLVIYRGLPEGHGSHVEEERPKGVGAVLRDSVDGYRTVVSDKLLRTFGVGVFFWYFLMQFGNFLYLVGLDQSIAGSGTRSEDVFSQVYASVYTSSSLVALFIQSVFTGALLRRFGIARVLFVLPLYAIFIASLLVSSAEFAKLFPGWVLWLSLVNLIGGNSLMIYVSMISALLHRLAP